MTDDGEVWRYLTPAHLKALRVLVDGAGPDAPHLAVEAVRIIERSAESVVARAIVRALGT